MAAGPVTKFAAAIRAHWFAAMSGGFSVPFAAFSAFADSIQGRLVWGALAVSAIVFSAYRIWKSEHDRAEEALERLRPKLKFNRLIAGFDPAVRIVKRHYSYDLELENDGAEFLDSCLVKLVRIEIVDGDPVLIDLPLTLRTDAQVERGDWGPFRLRPGENKPVHLIHQGNTASMQMVINHEAGADWLENVNRCILHVVAYGSPSPARATVEAWRERSQSNRLVARLIDNKKG